METVKSSLSQLPELRNVALNVGKVVDADAGRVAFKKLLVTLRPKVLRDGFEEPLDWTQAGAELTPAEWHDQLLRREEADEEKPLLLDCRNHYESAEGTFKGAEALGTDKFTESWKVLDDRLKDVDRSTPLMTFCTGLSRLCGWATLH